MVNRRRMLSTLGAGLLGPGLARADVHETLEVLKETLGRFAEVEWQQYAVMTKAPGVEPPWQLRLEAEYQAAGPNTAALDELLRYTRHASPHVRGFATQMLGVIGDPRGGERLRALLATDSEGPVRTYAVEALSRLTTAAADPVVLAAIAAARKDANANVRFSAQQAELRLQRRVRAGGPLRHQWTHNYNAKQLGSARIGSPAPDFTLTADDGKPVSLADSRGRSPVVLVFQLADW